MIAATLLFATMSMCVKFASESYSTGEIVFYRGIVGTFMMFCSLGCMAEHCAPACQPCTSGGVSQA